MNVLGFHHAAIQVRDVEKVASFYTQILRLPELRRFQREDASLRSIWVGTSTQGVPEDGFLAIEQAADSASSSGLGFSMVALRIEASERKALTQTLVAQGVRIERQTDWTVYVADPEGNLVGLSHYPDALP